MSADGVRLVLRDMLRRERARRDTARAALAIVTAQRDAYRREASDAHLAVAAVLDAWRNTSQAALWHNAPDLAAALDVLDRTKPADLPATTTPEEDR